MPASSDFALPYSAAQNTVSVHVFHNAKKRKAADEGKLRLRLSYLLMNLTREGSRHLVLRSIGAKVKHST
jgi:hypothetical protein